MIISIDIGKTSEKYKLNPGRNLQQTKNSRELFQTNKRQNCFPLQWEQDKHAIITTSI